MPRPATHAATLLLVSSLLCGCSGWTPLFDGETLEGWKPSGFLNAGEVSVEDGKMILQVGEILTGATYTGEFPKSNYEIRVEATRVSGGDFFYGLTFPYHDTHASLIIGGWGGTLCGISSFDGQDAANNSTTTFHNFENGQWYAIRLRVTDERFEAWLDDKQIVNIATKDREIDIRIEVEPSIPLGVSAFQSTAALRNFQWRPVP